MLIIFDSIAVDINHEVIDTIYIPNKCIKEIPINIENFGNQFIYITGLIILNQLYNDENKLSGIEMLISYGISDTKSGISKLKQEI